MPGPKPPAVPWSEEERQALHTMIRAHKPPQHLSFRAHVILRLAEGLTAPDVARRLGTTRTTVRRWRRHGLKRHGCPISERLQDAPRPGAPATFSAEQWCQIIALACEPPEVSGPILVMVSFTYMRSEADCVWRAIPRAAEIAGWRSGRNTRPTTCRATDCFYLLCLLITTSCQLRGSFLTCWSEDQEFRLASR